MSAKQLKRAVVDSLWQVVDSEPCIVSATLTGSFLKSDSLEGLSDIDFVVIVDQLDRTNFERLENQFTERVRSVLSGFGYRFRLNSTLGPLKFNEPDLAVLHLMLYSADGHREHVIKSPFTCLDWQGSETFRKASMFDVYPTFSLQPHHFLSARRSIQDYLRDYRKRVVSYRELSFASGTCQELLRAKSMDDRDRHEFAYHVIRFLMLNLLKLVKRTSTLDYSLQQIAQEYSLVFPTGADTATALLLELAEKKRRIDYTSSTERLDERLEQFIGDYETQFRRHFVTEATQHLFFRHAATELNAGPTRFVGRSNPFLLDSNHPHASSESEWNLLADAVEQLDPQVVFSSPLNRCQQTAQRVVPPAQPIVTDQRLIEINYGDCEAMTVAKSAERYPQIFEAWKRGEDPAFPRGESSRDVLNRIQGFLENVIRKSEGNTASCSHNVTIRSLVGTLMGIPLSQHYRINVPHLAPIRVIATKEFGAFLDLDEDVERPVFKNFASNISKMIQKQAA